jgi:thiamine biosynthesis lipoprotein
MSLVTRRRFVSFTAGVAAVSTAALWGLRNQSASASGRWERTGRAFGASATITVLHDDHDSAREAADAAWLELERVERLLTIYQPESAVSRLNATGQLKQPPRELVEVLRVAADMSRRSRGAFDITVQPLWEVYSSSQRHGQLPTREQEAAALALVDWRRVVVENEVVELLPNAAGQRPRITLNGIAQGYVTDRVLATLAAHGVEHALLDTGEMGALGGKQQREPWRVGIQHPRDPDAYIALADLEGRCLATSGDYSTPLSPDFSRHHVFDPRTGRSPSELSSVSIVAPTATDADALSTAVMVAGWERGRALVESSTDAAALLVAKDGRVAATRGFPLAAS